MSAHRGESTLDRASLPTAPIDMEETTAVLRSSERTELVRLLKKVGMWAAARLEGYDAKNKS
jgi:hypothetical protein